MPTAIPIQAIPNQSLSITLGNNLYELSIKEANGVMVVTVTRNGVEIISNLRAVAGSGIIPAMYLEAGNFMFLTSSQQLPYYTAFNVTQQLAYFTADELAAYRAATPSPVTVDDFNPAGGLPLRFRPQGYVAA